MRVDHQKLMGEKKKKQKLRKRQALLDARCKACEEEKESLTIGGAANAARIEGKGWKA